MCQPHHTASSCRQRMLEGCEKTGYSSYALLAMYRVHIKNSSQPMLITWCVLTLSVQSFGGGRGELSYLLYCLCWEKWKAFKKDCFGKPVFCFCSTSVLSCSEAHKEGLPSLAAYSRMGIHCCCASHNHALYHPSSGQRQTMGRLVGAKCILKTSVLIEL